MIVVISSFGVECAFSKTLKSHRNAHVVRGRLTLKEVKERQFRNESFREPQSSNELKAIVKPYSNQLKAK